MFERVTIRCSDLAGVHIGFGAPSREHVDRFWEAGAAAGYRSDGEPGPRPQCRDDYYGSFLLDPDGNSIEAVHHGGMRRDGAVDHIWIRVADVAAARDFYLTLAPQAGFRLKADEPELARFAGPSGSFTLIAGERPTENLRMAFAAGGAAGLERDPDGNEVELV